VLNSEFGGDLPISASGSFTFSTRLPDGSAFNVSVKDQPTSSPAQSCQVANGTGTIAAANVTTVDVTCTTGYTIRGMVSGLQGPGLVLQIVDPGSRRHPGHNVGAPLKINSDRPFTIVESPPTVSGVLLAEISQWPGSPYQRCLVRNAANRAANVTDFDVGCSQFVYVANAGDDTVSAYTIDPASGALAAIGTPVKTGMSPHAICETQDRAFVFVANEGSNNISTFAIDFVTGALTLAPGSPFPAGTDPRALGCDDGVNLYVANNGSSDDISAFFGGLLNPVSGSPFPAGGNPLSLAAEFGLRRGRAPFPFTAFGRGRRDFAISMTWPMGGRYALPLTIIYGNVQVSRVLIFALL
jgi:hypothetical protein